MFSERIIPEFVNVDLDDSLMPSNAARYIKNLAYSFEDTADAQEGKGKTGVYKPIQSVEEYLPGFTLPEGNNHPIGQKNSKETNEVFVFVYNTLGNHSIYRINGRDASIDMVYKGIALNFQLDPQYFIHDGGCAVTLLYVTNPETGEKVRRTFLQFTDGFNPPRFICVEDAIKTNGFDTALYPYLKGDYNPAYLISMGVPSPKGCIGITEIPLRDEEKGLQNTLLYTPWQFRLKGYDVWGRPTEHAIISDIYIPGGGGNDCIATSSGLSRCLSLSFLAPLPHINKLEIAYRNCNDAQWYTSEVLDLYVGSELGDWWLRQRNPDVVYDGETGLIAYTFCANKKCDPIATADTNRLYNPLPRISQAVANIGKFTALGNNMDGFLPFSKALRDSFVVTVESPDGTSINNKVRNISVYVAIYNAAYSANQPVYRKGITSTDPNNTDDLRYGFGAMNTDQEYRSFFAYKQYFPNAAQKGFTGYLRGTGLYTTSKQFFLRNTGEMVEVEDYSITGLSQFYSRREGSLGGGFQNKPNGTFLQRFDFTNVPRGKYIFSISNHQIDPTLEADFAKTSTYVIGTYGFNSVYFASPILYTNRFNETKEVVVDVCDGNFDGLQSGEILIIADLTFNNSDIEQGYVLNTNATGAAQRGVELLHFDGGDGDKKSNTTDYNGFYFTASGYSKFTSRISGYCNGSIVQLFPTVTTGNDNNAHPVQYKYLNESSGCPAYETQLCNYITIKGKVLLCGSQIGVPGLSVVFSRGGSAITNEDGEYTIIAYDEVDAPFRDDTLYFITNSCSFEGCDGGCIASIPVRINKVFAGCAAREISVADTLVTFVAIRGLLSDSTRPIGVVGWDWMDRPTFVQPLGDIVTPSVNQTKMFAPASVRIDILPTAVFPPETEYITFFIGEATGIEEYVSWIVDKVEFVDNSGEVNEEAPTQIRIYYGSLIEYNKQNNYNTNVNWQFIPEGQNRPVLGDRVQFLLNGDGTFFPTPITAIVKYDDSGISFLINYTTDLADLQENAVIRLVRPKACTSTEPQYEVCKIVQIENRKAEESSFYLNAFDTYYISRQIPVPSYTEGEQVPSVRILGVPFESPSPSDFWGYKCHNIGRINVENPNETVIYHEEQISLSGALSETGTLNFLNFFQDSDSTKFDFNQTKINGIVGMYPEPGAVLVIGQSDNFVVGFSDNIARINENGQVIAPSVDNQFGQPQNKIGSNYGCLLSDKSTLASREGLVHFLDGTRSALLQHNYDVALPISINGAISLIRGKVKSVQAHNLINTQKRYFTGIINPINNEYLLSDFLLGSQDYINELRDYDYDAQESHAFSIYSRVYRGCYSFTPELYSFLEGDVNDIQLFSFKQAVPFRHYVQTNATYGTVYGVPVNRVIRLIMSRDNLKKKEFEALAVYCKESVYFVDQAISETGQLTMMMKDHFRQASFGWYAPVLCDMNTLFDPNRPIQTGVNKLMDGDKMDGTYLDVRFIGDPEKDTVFSFLQGFIINVIPQDPSGQIQ